MKKVIVHLHKPLRSSSYRRDAETLHKIKEDDTSQFDLTLHTNHLSLLTMWSIFNKDIDVIEIHDKVGGVKYKTTIRLEDGKIVARNKQGELATDKELRVGHSLFKMYLGGEFFYGQN